MDGFRDRLNRGTSDRGSYDRYDRGSRRGGSYGAPTGGVSADEIAQLLDESNGKQLDVINDLFEDAKDDRYESEKQILAALDDVIAEISKKDSAMAGIATKEDIAAELAKLQTVKESQTADNKQETGNAEDSQTVAEILGMVNSNNDLLQQFAEEQLPMLVRGNSSILNQIRESIDEKDDLLREILRNTSMQDAPAPVLQPSNNEEVLNAANTNNALLNALRSDVAGISAEIRNTNERLSAKADENNEPLDSEDSPSAFTKENADEMYKNLEDVVHGECVKVYRNVQKVLEEQNTTAADNTKKAVGGVKGLVILNIVLALLNLIALLANVFGII